MTWLFWLLTIAGVIALGYIVASIWASLYMAPVEDEDLSYPTEGCK